MRRRRDCATISPVAARPSNYYLLRFAAIRKRRFLLE
jgi:hypothetical protein